MKRTKEQALKTKQAVLDAARHVFKLKGFAQTTLVDIAKEAGMTRGAIYWHFKDKSELFKELIVDELKEPVRVINQILGMDEKPLLKLRLIINSVLSMILRNPQLAVLDEIMLFQYDWMESHQDIHKIYVAVTGNLKLRIEEVIDEALRVGEIAPNVDLPSLETAIMSFIGGVKSNWVRTFADSNPDPDKMTEIIINGIAAR